MSAPYRPEPPAPPEAPKFSWWPLAKVVVSTCVFLGVGDYVFFHGGVSEPARSLLVVVLAAGCVAIKMAQDHGHFLGTIERHEAWAKYERERKS